jgi:hypothetical protein
MTEHAIITPADCECPEHEWEATEPDFTDDWGSWVRCTCCGLLHQLQPGERLFHNEVLYSADWLNEASLTER